MEEFENKAVMFTEVALVKHSNNVVLVVWIFLHDISKVLGFFMSKLMVHLCISSNLDSIDRLIRSFMVPTLNNLCKRPLSKYLKNLIPESNVLSYLYLVISFVIVEDRIALELAVTCILSICFQFVESFNSLVIESFANLKVLTRSTRNGACVIHHIELPFTTSQLLNFLL